MNDISIMDKTAMLLAVELLEKAVNENEESYKKLVTELNDKIAALEAENARIRKMYAAFGDMREEAGAVYTQNDKLQAENNRLRELIERLVNNRNVHFDEYANEKYPQGQPYIFIDLDAYLEARALLEAKE